MKLAAEDFNELLGDMGQDMLWRRAFACPCVNPASGAAKPGCTNCSGRGRYWPGSPVPTVVGVAGRDLQTAWANFGQAAAGDQVVIVGSDSPAYVVGAFDRFLSANRTEPFSMNLVRGVNERINFSVAGVDLVTYFDDGVLVEIPAPAVDSTGAILWDSGAPPQATTYALTGRRFAEWYVYPETPFDRPHHRGEKLPRRVVLRNFDLYRT